MQEENKVILTSIEDGSALNEVVLKKNTQGEYETSFHIEWKNKIEESDLVSWKIFLKESKGVQTGGVVTDLSTTPLPQNEGILGKVQITNQIANIDKTIAFTSDNLEKVFAEFEQVALNEVDIRLSVSKNVGFIIVVNRQIGQELLEQEIEIEKMPEVTPTPIVTPTVQPTVAPTSPPVITATADPVVSVAKVSGLKVSARTKTSITLTWNKVANASKYRIYYVDSNKKDIKLCDVTGTTKKISKVGKTLTAGTNVTFKVAAYHVTNGRITFGAKRSLNTTTKPNSTKIVKVSKKSKSSIQVQISKLSKVDGYHIVYSTKKASGYKKAYLGSNRMVTITKLSKRTYYLKVRTYKVIGTKKVYSAYSAPISFKLK